MLIIILLADTNVSGLISLYREIGAMLIGVGFLCAGLAVLKKLISNHERTKEAIITYITALVTWLISGNSYERSGFDTGCHTRLCHASLLLSEKEESTFFRKGEREADKGGGAQGRAGESLSGHLRGISA